MSDVLLCRWTMVAVLSRLATMSSIPVGCSQHLCLRATLSRWLRWRSCSSASGHCLPSVSRTADSLTSRCLVRCWNWCVVVTWVMQCLRLAAVAHVAVMMTSLQLNQCSLHQSTHGMTGHHSCKNILSCFFPIKNMFSCFFLVFSIFYF